MGGRGKRKRVYRSLHLFSKLRLSVKTIYMRRKDLKTMMSKKKRKNPKRVRMELT